MDSKLSSIISKIVLGGISLYFIYILTVVVSTVNRRHIGTTDGTYINNTQSNQNIHKLALELTKNCSDNNCRIQNILDNVTNIPYKINHFTAHSPQETIQKNFGDCDDKSNLLISLLHELSIESYFVLVPKHIFVIVTIDKPIAKKGIYLDDKKYYILESTATNSHIGFPLQYELNNIHAIVEPFQNRKLEIKKLEWKL